VSGLELVGMVKLLRARARAMTNETEKTDVWTQPRTARMMTEMKTTKNKWWV